MSEKLPRYDIVTGTDSFDPKGTNGYVFIRYLEIRKSGEYVEDVITFKSEIVEIILPSGGKGYKATHRTPVIVERHTWKDFEEFNGTIDPVALAKPYHEANKLADAAETAAEAADKKAAKQAKTEALIEKSKVAGANPELTKAVTDVVAANPEAVSQFKAGKEKAVNALIGQVLKLMPGVGAAEISILLKQEMSK